MNRFDNDRSKKKIVSSTLFSIIIFVVVIVVLNAKRMPTARDRPFESGLFGRGTDPRGNGNGHADPGSGSDYQKGYSRLLCARAGSGRPADRS